MSESFWKILVDVNWEIFDSSEELGELLCSLGSLGIEEKSSDELCCYIDKNVDEFLSKLKDRSIQVKSSEKLETQDWTAKCEVLLEPIEAGNIKIIPISSPSERPATSHNEYLLQPGLGFGTGHHVTTQLILELMQSDEILNHKPRKIIDVGTGSGILAIVAASMFSSSVLAIDNDNLALTNAKTNLSLNNITDSITLQHGTLKVEQTDYDLVLANIYAEVLVEYEPVFDKSLKPGSYLIVSGIMSPKKQLFEDCFKGWRVLRSESREQDGGKEWLAYLLQKPA